MIGLYEVVPAEPSYLSLADYSSWKAGLFQLSRFWLDDITEQFAMVQLKVGVHLDNAAATMSCGEPDLDELADVVDSWDDLQRPYSDYEGRQALSDEMQKLIVKWTTTR